MFDDELEYAIGDGVDDKDSGIRSYVNEADFVGLGLGVVNPEEVDFLLGPLRKVVSTQIPNEFR